MVLIGHENGVLVNLRTSQQHPIKKLELTTCLLELKKIKNLFLLFSDFEGKIFHIKCIDYFKNQIIQIIFI